MPNTRPFRAEGRLFANTSSTGAASTPKPGVKLGGRPATLKQNSASHRVAVNTGKTWANETGSGSRNWKPQEDAGFGVSVWGMAEEGEVAVG